MKRSRLVIVVSLAIFSLTVLAAAKDKKPKSGPLAGTWTCTAHGGPNGDMPFTLYLDQRKETVSGSVSSPIGDTDISSGTFKNKAVEIHIDSPQGNYLLHGKLKHGQLAGDWSVDSGSKGTWEGKKSAANAN